MKIEVLAKGDVPRSVKDSPSACFIGAHKKS